MSVAILGLSACDGGMLDPEDAGVDGGRGESLATAGNGEPLDTAALAPGSAVSLNTIPAAPSSLTRTNIADWQEVGYGTTLTRETNGTRVRMGTGNGTYLRTNVDLAAGSYTVKIAHSGSGGMIEFPLGKYRELKTSSGSVTEEFTVTVPGGRTRLAIDNYDGKAVNQLVHWVALQKAGTTTTSTQQDVVPTSGIVFADTLDPGESIQNAVNKHGPGAAFLIRGTHKKQMVEPKDSQKFIGATGATLDGGGTAKYAFRGSASNVTIRGLVIQNYANEPQYGAIHGPSSKGWIVENNVIQNNAGSGIRVGHRMIVRNNKILRQQQLGIGGSGDDVLIEGNEIAYNNYAAKYSWGWEAGGTKLTHTRNLVVRNNYSHHNHGPGLWTDINNIYTLYEGNRSEDNVGPGIFHEISYDAVIRNNTTRRNGVNASQPYSGAAGILVSASRNVEIYGNIVEDNGGGIVAMQQKRGSGTYGEYRVVNLWVHDNRVRWNKGYTGIVRDDGNNTIFSSQANNRFDRNTYDVDSASASRWAWNNGGRNWSYWRSAGLDPNGTAQ